MTAFAQRLSPNYLDRKVLFNSYHPEIPISLIADGAAHISDLGPKSKTNQPSFSTEKELHPQSELREYRVTAGQRECTQPKVISLCLGVHCTLYAPHKKYVYLLNDSRISSNELLEYAIPHLIPFVNIWSNIG